MFYTLLITIISFPIILYIFFERKYSYWSRKNVQFLKPSLLFGNIKRLAFLRESYGDVLKYLHERGGRESMLGFYFFASPYLLIRDPDLIKTIFVKDFARFRNRMLSESLDLNKSNDPVSTNALCVLDYPKWKSSRSVLSAAFSTAKLKSSVIAMNQVGEKMTNYILGYYHNNDNAAVDAKDIATRFTTDLLVHFIYGLDAKCFEKHKETRFIKDSDGFFRLDLNRAVQFGSGFFYPQLSKLMGFNIMKKSSSIFLRNIFRHAMNVRRKSVTNDVDCKRDDLLDYFLRLQKNDNGHNFDDDKLSGQAASFFLAGNETTSATIAFTLHELSLNRSVQEKLRKEIVKHTTTKTGNVLKRITYEEIMEMKYLDTVVNETLRKYPPLSFLDRRTVTDYAVPGTNLNVEKGTGIFVSLLGLHRDRRFYPDPEKYDPDRFHPDNAPNLTAYTFLPLGCGPHSCIAGRYGILAVKLALVHILNSFEVHPAPNAAKVIEFDVKCPTLVPKCGLHVIFKAIV